MSRIVALIVPEERDEDLLEAAREGNLEEMKRLYNLFNGEGLLEELAKRGNLDGLKWVHERNMRAGRKNYGNSDITDAIIKAIEGGHLHVLKWIRETPNICHDSDHEFIEAMDRAAEYGQLEIFKWLCTLYKNELNEETLIQAADNGHLHILQWIKDNLPITHKVKDGGYPLWSGIKEVGTRPNVQAWLDENIPDFPEEDEA